MFGCCNVYCNDKSTCFAEGCFDEFSCFRTDVPVIMLPRCFNVLLFSFISAHRPRGTVPAQNHNAATATKEKEVHVRNCVILEIERGQEMKGKTGGRRAKEVEESAGEEREG